jgi:hypothetical protein
MDVYPSQEVNMELIMLGVTIKRSVHQYFKNIIAEQHFVYSLVTHHIEIWH